MICVSCLAKFHSSCLNTSCECSLKSHSLGAAPSPTPEEDSNVPDQATDETHVADDDVRLSLRSGSGRSGNSSTRRHKRDANLKDQQSTGRKRAARQYPLDRSAPCEWAGNSNCGGGLYPILGCISGLQQARHHGPDKSVSNNEEGNVHRICHYCHNRWHSANNAEYDWNDTRVKPHAPVGMTEEQRKEAMLMQMTSRSKQFKIIKD